MGFIAPSEHPPAMAVGVIMREFSGKDHFYLGASSN
jgi:hypothetical protein